MKPHLKPSKLPTFVAIWDSPCEAADSYAQFELDRAPKTCLTGDPFRGEGFETRGASREDPQALVADPLSQTDKLLVSIVVPTYREADNLPLLVPRITEAVGPWPHEIIIVDDNSNDGTDRAVKTLRKQGHVVRLILRTDQRGLSSAVLRGFSQAKGRVLVCMDAI